MKTAVNVRDAERIAVGDRKHQVGVFRNGGIGRHRVDRCVFRSRHGDRQGGAGRVVGGVAHAVSHYRQHTIRVGKWRENISAISVESERAFTGDARYLPREVGGSVARDFEAGHRLGVVRISVGVIAQHAQCRRYGQCLVFNRKLGVSFGHGRCQEPCPSGGIKGLGLNFSHLRFKPPIAAQLNGPSGIGGRLDISPGELRQVGNKRHPGRPGRYITAIQQNICVWR